MAKKSHSGTGGPKKPRTNPLRPSQREKKRYMAFEIMSEKPLPVSADRDLIAKINSLLGVFESAKAGILRAKYEPSTQRGVFRVDRKYVDLVRACFVMIKSLGNEQVMVRTLKVSGMINKVTPEMAKPGLKLPGQ